MSSQIVFPSLIYRKKLAPARKLHSGLIRETHLLEERDTLGQKWSKENYRGGYSSYSSQSSLHHTSSLFAELEEQIRPHVTRFARDLHWDLGDQKLKMTDCWVNIMPEGASHAFHIHPHSSISGTYYVQVPKGAAALRLEDPRLPLFMAAPVRREKAPAAVKPVLELHPVSGDLILFESWMRHEVPPNRSTSPRISVSFNYHLC